MQELTSIAALREQLTAERRAGRTIGLVPTMGFLHEGHLRLVDAARAASNVVVMSAFVNPLQFAPNEDFDRYPRDPERDRALARDRGVDFLFVPTVSEVYQGGAVVTIAAGAIGTRLEGAVRPGHFDGVLTIVAKLFNIITPDVACFGQKDIQQVTLIRRMIADLNFPIRLVVAPTVREPDGLAMSSRNVYLSPEDRRAALALSLALRTIDNAWRDGERSAAKLAALASDVLQANGVVPDYVAIVDPDQLLPAIEVEAGTIVAIAARVGKTRLIDNVILGVEGAGHAA
jgi:pantoate--beta-alanine ligase